MLEKHEPHKTHAHGGVAMSYDRLCHEPRAVDDLARALGGVAQRVLRDADAVAAGLESTAAVAQLGSHAKRAMHLRKPLFATDFDTEHEFGKLSRGKKLTDIVAWNETAHEPFETPELSQDEYERLVKSVMLEEEPRWKSDIPEPLSAANIRWADDEQVIAERAAATEHARRHVIKNGKEVEVIAHDEALVVADIAGSKLVLTPKAQRHLQAGVAEGMTVSPILTRGQGALIRLRVSAQQLKPLSVGRDETLPEETLRKLTYDVAAATALLKPLVEAEKRRRGTLNEKEEA